MQLTQKHIISLATVSIFAMIGYGIFQNSTPSQSDGVKLSTGTVTPISQSGIETDTGKRLETVANSGTQWGMSPFGSGKPLEEAEKKPVFQKPNTEWKTRTLSGITYVFGEGNPKQVAFTATGIQQELRTCEVTPGSTARMCSEGRYGYVTPEIEVALRNMLESPLWENLITRCEKEYSNSDDYMRFQKNILAAHALDITHFLVIDKDTGRKEIETMELREIALTLSSVGAADDRGEWKNICISSYSKPLYQMINNITAAYSASAAIPIQESRMNSRDELVTDLNH